MSHALTERVGLLCSQRAKIACKVRDEYLAVKDFKLPERSAVLKAGKVGTILAPSCVAQHCDTLPRLCASASVVVACIAYSVVKAWQHD